MLHKVYQGERCVEFDDDKSYREYCARYKEVNAAGGLVHDAGGNYMLIRRNGLWDLPKGHQEPGEDIRDTASREVWEETGVGPLAAGELICVTDHCYFRDDVWHLKHTWWYDMESCEPASTKPQTEEGITEVAWVPWEERGKYLEETYPSIVEVFEKLKR